MSTNPNISKAALHMQNMLGIRKNAAVENAETLDAAGLLVTPEHMACVEACKCFEARKNGPCRQDALDGVVLAARAFIAMEKERGKCHGVVCLKCGQPAGPAYGGHVCSQPAPAPQATAAEKRPRFMACWNGDIVDSRTGETHDSGAQGLVDLLNKLAEGK